MSETYKFNIESENNFPILIDTNSVDISSVSNIIVVEDDDLDRIGRYTIPIREKYCYTDMLYDTLEREWYKLCSVIEINNEEPTIEASENK